MKNQKNGWNFWQVGLINKRQKPETVELVAVFHHDSINELVSTHPGSGGNFMFTNYDFTDTAEVILSAKDKRLPLDISLINPADPLSEYFSFRETFRQKEEDTIEEIFGEMLQLLDDMEENVYEIPEVVIKGYRPMKRDPRALINPEFAAYIYKVEKNTTYGGHGAFGILLHIPNGLAKNTFNYGMDETGGFVGSQNLMRIFAGNPDLPFILDGRYVSKAELEAMPSSAIERVEVLERSTAMLYGGRQILFYTRNWKERASSIMQGTVVYQFAGYNQPKEFYSPDYSMPQQYFNPDSRNTLYWQPYVQLDEDRKGEVSFYTSDDTSEYNIICEGRSNDGTIGVSSSTLRINANQGLN